VFLRGGNTVGQHHALVGGGGVYQAGVEDAGARLHDGASSAWWLVI